MRCDDDDEEEEQEEEEDDVWDEHTDDCMITIDADDLRNLGIRLVSQFIWLD